ncbi:OmpA family protein [Chitinimonas sp.]|uniref:OmpA family protein n=1 Tax=Chitinimonas sp. TaxID=1934313 RepID=UPI0035B3522A
MNRLKPLPKFLLIAAVVGSALFGGQYAIDHGLVPKAHATAAALPGKTDYAVNDAPAVQPVANLALKLPGTTPAKLSAPQVRMEVMAWNAQMGLMLANGGADTTEGSLMQQHGVNLKLIRQDDTGQMQNDLLAFAKSLADGEAQPKTGAHFAVIMGDGSAAFFAGLQPQLAKLGPDYTAQIIGAAGYSRGEDKCMGLPAWQHNPAAARGALVAGVLRDGDWNICLKWAGDNGIANNPDEKTWDPDAINWVSTDNFVDSGEKYIAGYCEDRPVVHAGRRTGETKHVCVNGVATWTPVDVTIAHKKGGLVSLASTRDYRWQMPAVVIGNQRWMAANADMVQGLLAAMVEGGDQVKASTAALHKAAQVSAAVYKEQDADYWQRYYTGLTETDKQGLQVALGGSTVNNLADNLYLFGIDKAGKPLADNLFSRVYRVFGNLVVQQYPALVGSYPAVGEVVNTRYLAALAQKAGPQGAADQPRFAGEGVKQVVSRRIWRIPFDTGRATFTPQAELQLRELLDQASVAGGLAIEIHGHTDSVGSPQANQDLSERRALAVKQWLATQDAADFPDSRIRTFAHGGSEFIASNGSEAGRAQNRRVEVVLGSTGKQ